MSAAPDPPDPQDAHQPVEPIATDSPLEGPSPGVALCLSGGGFRAMLFHAGALMRLNELGLLQDIERISSVSGGSITAAVLGLNWEKLDFDSATKVGRKFAEVVVSPLRKFAERKIDIPSILKGIFLPGRISERVASAYRDHLFGKATLRDLPDRPRFVINASNVQSKALWRFSKPYMWDYRVGKIEKPMTELAVAVAASSAFPPVLSPVVLKHKETDYVPNTGLDLQRSPFTTNVVLTDGGVYDNLGLETAWKRYQTIWVSDAGGMYSPEANPKNDWYNHTRRIFDLIDNQVRSLRKRQLMDSYKQDQRKGAYWGIWTDIEDYKLGTNALACPVDKTREIASVSTRLTKLDPATQERIINWGYAVCDAAMRKYGGVDAKLKPDNFPYPKAGVG